MRSALALVTLAVAGCASSPPREVVLTGAVEGDRACYLAIDGEHQDVFASFDVCSEAQALLGQRVRLTFERGQIQAASCEGDPSCTRTEEVLLVVAIQPAE